MRDLMRFPMYGGVVLRAGESVAVTAFVTLATLYPLPPPWRVELVCELKHPNTPRL
jgi:hypothetical protein